MTEDRSLAPDTSDADATHAEADQFVGRAAGQDEGYAEETGAERRGQE